jgi:hypothetical protein
MTAISMSPKIYNQLVAHLSSTEVEQVAFIFTEPPAPGSPLRARELHRIPSDEFSFQSDYHVELTDEVRAHVIKHAWDTGGALIEAHSHVGAVPAVFSGSDLAGFADWVPHVRWRLGGRVYVALVFANSSFDALVWEGDDSKPHPLDSLNIDGRPSKKPSSLTYQHLSRKPRKPL